MHSWFGSVRRRRETSVDIVDPLGRHAHGQAGAAVFARFSREDFRMGVQPGEALSIFRGEININNDSIGRENAFDPIEERVEPLPGHR